RLPCPGGETGRRTGLKIPGPERGVTVRFRPRAPMITSVRMGNDKHLRSLAKRFRVTDGSKFRLKDFDPADHADFGKTQKEEADELLARSRVRMAELQDMLYAQDRWALLLIFQAMDAAGKDGTIKHVMSGVNPQGCQVYSFKTPSAEELDHDFLWRA